MARLVLLRHGQSTWNLENRFTGWEDVPLSEQGVAEAHEAAELLLGAGVEPEILHTSLLVRAIDTAQICLGDMKLAWLPVRRSWRLNERHYGALQGLNKSETAEKYGDEQVLIWRRSYATPPPDISPDDPRHPRHDRRYRDVPPGDLPGAESLKDVVARMLPYWESDVVPDLRSGACVLLAAHGNSLRALVKHLDNVSEEEIVELNIPTGVPLVYELDENLRPVSSAYVGDPSVIAAKAEAVARQATAGPPHT
ncbi:MAG TPA: 2,3-diphosphoglycerate-dependent phosphoglycerate mutase [Candidatus Solibacter sp.]|jgi:2,3-bisphosphoglycerate-dependent phosphoglycerate mutase|nr:2,3-diphosphoglycerate-dependent phosphoglycerate mutase [Candidatus Solibacter sp.]